MILSKILYFGLLTDKMELIVAICTGCTHLCMQCKNITFLSALPHNQTPRLCNMCCPIPWKKSNLTFLSWFGNKRWCDYAGGNMSNSSLQLTITPSLSKNCDLPNKKITNQNLFVKNTQLQSVL